MIARLAGTIAETNSDNAVILAAGVGYQVHMSGRSLEALGPGVPASEPFRPTTQPNHLST